VSVLKVEFDYIGGTSKYRGCLTCVLTIQ